MSKASDPQTHPWWELFRNPKKATRQIIYAAAGVFVMLLVTVMIRPEIIDTISQAIKGKPSEQAPISNQAIGPAGGLRDSGNVKDADHVNVQQAGNVHGNNEMNINSKNTRQ